MSRRREKIIITVETFKRTTVRWRQKVKTACCVQCAAETQMLAPDDAAALLQTTAREIFLLAETGEIHFGEIETGARLVCRDSLTAFLAQEKEKL